MRALARVLFVVVVATGSFAHADGGADAHYKAGMAFKYEGKTESD